MRCIRPQHWAVVLGAALAVHAAFFMRYGINQTPQPKALNGSEIRIALAPTSNQPANGVKSAKDSKPKAKKGKTKKSQPETKPETSQRAAPDPEQNPKPEPKPKTDPKSEPQPKNEPKPHQKSEPQPKPKQQSAAKQRPESEPKPEPKPKVAKKSRSKNSPRPTPSGAQSQDRTSNAAGERKAAAKVGARQKSSQQQTSVTVGAGALPPSYRDKLRGVLARHKNYPRRARRRGLQGRAVIHLIIGHDGQIIDWSFRRRTGHNLLNQAIQRMIESSNPFPAFPRSLSAQRLQLTLPVVFKLQ